MSYFLTETFRQNDEMEESVHLYVSSSKSLSGIAPPSPSVPVICRQESLPPSREEYDVPIVDQLGLLQKGVAKLDEDEFSSALSTLQEVRAPTIEVASALLEQVTDPKLFFMVLALVPLFKCFKPYRNANQGLDVIFNNFEDFGKIGIRYQLEETKCPVAKRPGAKSLGAKNMEFGIKLVRKL
ncbi:hypothetical protein GCK72_022972 [Caenorhabditis remanei]|nr:hypothetical protein GCK72_022972 [Caenorhabditis remanei]KAF1746516.1 hypothetical protein GCK72_022972 [Caenorhabditis remanei]